MIALEKILEASKISCPNKPHGCPARIPYYKKSEHKTSCPYCPCFCPEVSCNFASSPKLLLEHAKDVHNPLVHKFKYGVAFYACISDSFRFKVLEDREDRIFLLSLNDIGQGKRALSLVCVRAPGSCGPEFLYKLTLERDVSDASSSNNSSSNNKKRGRRLKFSGPVMNSTLEERMIDDGLFLVAPDSGASKEFSVSVCVKMCGLSEVKEEVA
ncbi:hypothetical protein LUZ60_009878 [Juncus effusus]|nr:hypothetical protein LUZ60_009878 [Juncus effusus]